jgi:antitoxin component of RelBE/YafQ-DinJ toxin-antitoxin module
MQTANIKIKTDSKTKTQALKLAKNLGMDLNTVLNDFLNNLINAPKSEFNNRYWQAIFKQAKTLH